VGLLPSPRRLKSGLFFYGCSKFEGVWRKYNTRCAEKKTAAEVVAAVEVSRV